MHQTSASLSEPDEIVNAAAPPTVAAAMVLVSDAVRAGQVELAFGLIRSVRSRFGSDPGIELAEMSLLVRAKRLDAALSVLRTVKQQWPGFVVAKIYEAQLMTELGQREAAVQLLSDAALQCPDYPGLAGALASTMMPGPGYRDVLGALHQLLRPRAYLEIGVETGATLALSKASRIIGVDPDLSPLRRDAIAPQCQLFEMTSAEFFSRHRADETLAGLPLDLVFIDGLHRFEAAIADFAEVERWAHERTVVVMHDALPILPVYAEASRRTRFWVGDVWKAVVLLRSARPDLRIRIIRTPPSGLVVVTQLKPQANRPRDWYQAALSAAESAMLSDRIPAWPAEFPVVSNDANGYRDALGV